MKEYDKLQQRNGLNKTLIVTAGGSHDGAPVARAVEVAAGGVLEVSSHWRGQRARAHTGYTDTLP